MGACCAAVNAKQLLQNNIMVRDAQSINKLRSTDIICVDQNTLQTNIMTCQHVFYDLKECLCDTEIPTNAIRGDFYVPDTEKRHAYQAAPKKKRQINFLKLIRCAVLNNSAFLTDNSNWTGDSAEIAIAKFASGHIMDEYSIDVQSYREKHATDKVEYFANTKYKVSIHALPDDMLLPNDIKLQENHDEKKITSPEKENENENEEMEPNQRYSSENVILAASDAKSNQRRSRKRKMKSNQYLYTMKGAPEKILTFCNRYLFEGSIIDLTDEKRNEILDSITSVCARGEYVSGLAEVVVPKDEYTAKISQYLGKAIFVGFIASINPPSPGAPDGVQRCKSLGVKVVMMSHDHVVTAQAIAEKCNIIDAHAQTKKEVADSKYDGCERLVGNAEYDAMVISGTMLHDQVQTESDENKDIFWNNVLNKTSVVFARINYSQKLLIIKAFQKYGKIVMVTGDGAFDVDALKQADVGIAMGMTGTDVAKEAADMIVLDDSFASIVDAIHFIGHINMRV